MSEKIKVICIVGPTASGKTALGVDIAKKFDGEIVSADSMQIYKGMPVASAVPTEDEKNGIPHHLMEIISSDNKMTVAQYVLLAHEKIKDITARGKTPIIVGGTGLYIDSLINNLTFTEEKDNPETRKRLEEEYDLLGGEEMHKRLEKIDPETANRVSPMDKKRLVRAFEIFENCGITMSKQYELSRQNESPYESIIIGIKYEDREKLYDRINRRVDIMVENGLLDEAKSFYKNENSKTGAFQAIGHKEIFPFFSGELSLEEAKENLKRQTRRYAKRQLTWFNKNEKIHWVYPDVTPDVLGEAIKIIDKEW